MSTLVFAFCSFLVIVLVKLCKLYAARLEYLKKISHVPGPKPLPVLGNGLDFKNPAELLPLLMKYTKEYGPSYKLHLGPDVSVFTSDPKLIEFVTTSNTIIKKSISYRFLYNWLGTGLLTAENPKWKLHRKIVTPTFHFKILEDCIPIFHANAQNLNQHLSKSIGKDINIYEDVVLCSLDVICEAAMGFSINALKDSNSNYVKSVKYMGIMVIERTFSIWRQFDFLYKNSPDYKKEKQSVDYLHSVTDKMIQAKRLELKNKKQTQKSEDDELYGKQKFAFLDMLIKHSDQEGGSLSDYDIRQEVDTFMFAGHDTISSAISFTLYLLAKHQDVQDKVYEEIATVLGKDRTPSMENLNNLKYMEMVLKESMRLYPPVPMVGRELIDDVTYNGQIYPKGLTLILVPYIMHRNPEIYEDPEKFNPDRFATAECAKRSIFSYIPFSAGPRNCIGQKFAMLEMKTLICSLLMEHKFLEVPNFEIIPVSEAVLKSLDGISVRVEKR